MPTTVTAPAGVSMTEPDGDLFDLDIRIVESGPVIAELLRSTSDNCGGTCASACTSCRS
jgi:FxLD family lantipeptide